jgi:hypothetical protein
MKITSIVLASILCLPAFAQNGRIMAGSAKAGAVGFSFETRLEPPSPRVEGLGLGGVVNGSPAAHRFTADSIHHVYFGYDIAIEPASQANLFTVTIRPLSVAREQLAPLTNPSAWTVLPLPGYPAAKTVSQGDTIALDLLENHSTGQKIVDYIVIQNQTHLSTAIQGTARDFSVEDAELRVAQPKVTVNGRPVETEEDFRPAVTGAVVWFSLPNRGYYVLSIAPHPSLGFVKAGEIRADSLTFTVGGDTITLDCNGPIAPGFAPYNLYVRQSPTWLRNPNGQAFFELGAAARAEAAFSR